MVNSCPSSLNRDSLAWNRDSSARNRDSSPLNRDSSPLNRDSSRLDKFLPLPLAKGGEGEGSEGDSARAGICELWLSDWYYIYDPDAGELYGFVRDESGHLRRVAEMRGWVSPLLRVRFELAGGELVVVRPDGERFVGYEELAAALEEAQARAAQERLLREQEQQRAERLAQKLRELGVEPD
jgi:hypothetical protein